MMVSHVACHAASVEEQHRRARSRSRPPEAKAAKAKPAQASTASTLMSYVTSVISYLIVVAALPEECVL